MNKHTAEIVVDIDVTPEELADLFWSMDEIEMRRFFNALALQADFTDFSSQIYEVVGGQESAVTLTDKAINVMREIGYAVGLRGED